MKKEFKKIKRNKTAALAGRDTKTSARGLSDEVLGCKKSDDTPVCMGGCSKTNEQGVGIVWLLSTPEIVNHQKCLLKNLKKEIEDFDKKFWLTFNFLYKENKLAKRWLSKFGYVFDKPSGMNIPQDFELFYRKRHTRGLNNGASTSI